MYDYLNDDDDECNFLNQNMGENDLINHEQNINSFNLDSNKKEKKKLGRKRKNSKESGNHDKFEVFS